jgi:hypothetical protein
MAVVYSTAKGPERRVSGMHAEELVRHRSAAMPWPAYCNRGSSEACLGTILYAKDMIRGQDLMLIENFR